MATISDGIGFKKGGMGHPANGVYRQSTVVVELDFAKISAARAAAGVPALGTSDVLQVIPVQAGTVVSGVGMQIVKPGSANTAKLSLDGGSTAEFLAATTLGSGAAGYYGGVPVLDTGAFAPASSGGKLFSANGYITATISTAVPVGAVVRVFATLTDVS